MAMYKNEEWRKCTVSDIVIQLLLCSEWLLVFCCAVSFLGIFDFMMIGQFRVDRKWSGRERESAVGLERSSSWYLNSGHL